MSPDKDFGSGPSALQILTKVVGFFVLVVAATIVGIGWHWVATQTY